MPVNNRSVDRQTLRHFWRVGRELKRDLYISSLGVISGLCISVFSPFIVGKILGGLASGHTNVNRLVVIFIIVSAVAVVCNRVGFRAFFTWLATNMGRFQTEAYDMLIRRGLTFHNNRVGGKLVSDAIDYPSAFSQLATVLYTVLIPFVLSIVGGLIVLTISSPILGLLMFVMSVVAISSGIQFRVKMTPYRTKRLLANKALTSHLADSIVNIHAVKTFAREEDELQHHHQLNVKVRDGRIHDWGMLAVNGSNRILGLLIFEAIFILVIVHLVQRNPHLLGAGIFAFSYTVSLTNRLFDVGTMLRNIDDALQLAEPITVALQEVTEVVDKPHAIQLQVVDGAIDFNNVSFAYSDTGNADAVFHKLDLHIAAGERLGLVGPSGGGKSTITKLLLRFEDIQSGSIAVDGTDIASVTQQSLRSAIAYVPQESLLFHRTILENIRYGNPAASEADVQAAAQQANAHDFIIDLPAGYDTIVGERGIKLSGGQRQRIAIARALLKNAPILLLDEATSALDSESEQAIQSALWELMQQRTALVIAHRLSTIQHLDRIVVLDKGRIVESGTHQELLANKQLYARLWSHQSGGFLG